MKALNNIKIIGIDHGYGNIKTANTITPTGVIPSANRPAFGSNILRCDGMYYSCGEGHKAFISDKSGDNDYYLLTLMGSAKELRRAGISEADVYLAAGLPLTWVKSQRGEFTNYLMRNERIEFEFNDRLYKLRFVGCSVFPQGYTAVIDRLVEMRGVNMLADIGNGTMNIMYITNSRPVASNLNQIAYLANCGYFHEAADKIPAFQKRYYSVMESLKAFIEKPIVDMYVVEAGEWHSET